MKKIFTYPLILLVRLYKILISNYTLSTCRYLPTCSDYTIEALKEYGILKGSKLAIKRILSCHPWGSSGYNPVPKKVKK